MRFRIRDIVKDRKHSQLIVLATKDMPLNADSLTELNRKGVLKIVKIDLLVSRMFKDITTGLMSSRGRLYAFAPIPLDKPTHSNLPQYQNLI